MKRGRITLGLSLILIGLILLMKNVGFLTNLGIRDVINFWPLILILLGFELIAEEKLEWMIFFTLLFLLGFFVSRWLMELIFSR